MATKYFIGTSGFHYDDWKGHFYPDGLPKTEWLEFYSREFSSVELNNTFYRLPSENSVKIWEQTTPRGFIFSVKASRYIIHIKRLKDTGGAVERFLERISPLGAKLGPVLYQLPSSFHRDDEVLDHFLRSLPPKLKHVFEFRHESWFEDPVFEILRWHKAGFCVFNQPEMTSPVTATSDFAYVRFHGSDSLYSSKYSDDELLGWSGRIQDLATGLVEVYIYFNNDVQGFAIENARTLKSMLGK